MSKRSADDFEHDDTGDTDELPVLLDPVELEDAARLEHAAGLPADASIPEGAPERTEIFALGGALAGSQPRPFAVAPPDEQVPALEAQIGVLTDEVRDLEHRLTEKDRRLEELRETVSSIRRSSDDSTATERRLATQLAVRDARIAEFAATIERLEEASAAGSAEIERLLKVAESRNSEVEALRRELAAKPDPTPAQTPAPLSASAPPNDDLRENYATLRSYIAARRAWWDEMQASNAQLAARVTGLEQELAASAKSLSAAEAFASRESSRAVGIRAELVGYTRRVDELERELRLLRGTPGGDTAIEAGSDVHALAAAAAVSAPSGDAGTAFGEASSRQAPPAIIDAVEAISPAVEAIAQLEAEVEYKRQQVAAQLVELHDRDQLLRAATSEVGALRNDLDDSRSNVARLEQTVADKDRALEARDARIATLHEELKQRAAFAEKRGDVSSPSIRAAAHEAAVDNTATPILICLTGDAPKRFALTKSTITVGRGPHCDLQIITHFVSREHARLTLSGDATLIEDLGSRNGVYVNSVRVDRRHLQQGDLVTIGETQFRFVESVAH
jgi:hypothetical protein